MSLCGSVHKQRHKAAAPYSVRRIRAVRAVFWSLCASAAARYRHLVASASIDGKHDFGTHTRTPTRRGRWQYTTRSHGASQRIAVQRIRCYVNNLSLFAALTPSTQNCTTACTGRCLFRQAAPPARARWFAACTSECSSPYLSPCSPHHTLQSSFARRRSAGADADAAAQVNAAC